MKIIVLTTAYNCEKWIKKCLSSIQDQTFKNFECYILNDLSTDGTQKIAEQFSSNDGRFILVNNTKKYYQPGNYDQVLRSNKVNDNDIAIQVDGDDWLPDNSVFERISKEYENPDTWLTYGQFQYSDGRVGFARAITPETNPRTSHFGLCALRSWKVFLWRRIVQQDLFDHSGWYAKRGGDTFFMFPMVEMATHKHIKFTPQINYIYNEENPINDHKVSAVEQNNCANFARSKKPYAPINIAAQYLSPLRFDIIAKLLYSKYRELNIQSDFGEKVYKEHLRSFTNGKFIEYDRPEKNTYDKYKQDFDTILDSIKTNGFDKQFPAPVDSNGNLLNGSHRISACIIHNRVPLTVVTSDPQAGQQNCSSYYFKTAGLSETYLDAMATEYCYIQPNTKLLTLYPARNENADQAGAVDRMIKQSVPVVYEKKLQLNNNGLFNYISQMYFGESWISTQQDPLAGIKHQTQKCLGKSSVKVYLIECENIDKANELKRKIRELYKIGKPSVHINDTHEQTVRAARTAFNNNCIYFMNHAAIDLSSDFWKLLITYRKILKDTNLPCGNFCVTGSAVLQLFGLRNARDLDYIHQNPTHVIQGIDLINSHEQELPYYPTHKHDILYNDFNHFYFNDIKFASLDVVKKLKQKRNEPKDIEDVRLIDSIYNG